MLSLGFALRPKDVAFFSDVLLSFIATVFDNLAFNFRLFLLVFTCSTYFFALSLTYVKRLVCKFWAISILFDILSATAFLSFSIARFLYVQIGMFCKQVGTCDFFSLTVYSG